MQDKSTARSAVATSSREGGLLDSYSTEALSWLKTLPSSLDRVDLFALNNQDFAVRFLRALFEGPHVELEVETMHPSSLWFNHFYFEARNREKVFGTRNLGVGYPVAFFKVDEVALSAPLFVWQFLLEPHAQHPDRWIVQRTPMQRIIPNYPLFHLVDQLYDTRFSQRARSLIEGSFLKPASLSAFVETFQKQLALSEEGLPLSILPNPDINQLANIQAAGQLRWSAVAGIFPTLARTITAGEAPSVNPRQESGLTWEHPFCPMPLDPSQRSVLHAAQRNTLTVVEGASGTGKTYVLAAIVMNALANGKKCLIVSKSISALRRAQKFLIDRNMGDLSFVVRDIESDRLMLADMLRAAAESKFKDDVPASQEFQALLHRTLRHLHQLDSAWKDLHAPLLGQRHFSELVGLFMQANRIEGKELLLSQLNAADFAFTTEEYEGIKAAIFNSEPLFRRFPTLHHPLASLKHDIFLERSSADGLAWTETRVKQLLQKATDLHHRYIAKINEYTELLTEHYENHYAELASIARRIREALEDGGRQFGPEFERPLSTVEKLYGVFSERYKQMVAAKEKISADYKLLCQKHLSQRYFEFEFPSDIDVGQIPRIAEQVRNYEKTLQQWLRSVPSLVRDDVRRLNGRNVHPAVDFHATVVELEEALDAFLQEFNNSGVYQEPLKHDMLTIPMRQVFLEGLIERLEDTQFYLRDFEDFYIWQRHWLSLSTQEQQVVRALCKIKPHDWTSAFDSWYLYHFLQKRYHPGLIWEEENLRAYYAEREALDRLLPAYTRVQWHARKGAALKHLRSTAPEAYKTWFGKDNRTLSLQHKAEELFEKHLFVLSETLPALFVTTQVAQDVVQLSSMKYDLVLVDEAHNIPKQECYHLFSLGSSLVVFGDAKQDMTPSAEDDFLEYCKSLGGPVYQLEYQHQHTPEEWVRFNQIAFGTPFKRLPSGLSARGVTVVVNVEGRYDERTGTNEAEARQILDWLNLIEPTPAKTYPVVGIACATVEQRDLVASQLLKIRQRKMAGHEKIQQLHLNGLGVYQFAELQGQHVDILLVSLVHGLIDAQGTLTQHLHFWNTQLGFNQLHVLMTRATQRIYIAHSIPPGLYKALAANKNFRGTCVLSHLVTFGELVQQGNRQAAEEQLAHMRELLEYPVEIHTSSLFAREVELALKPYFLPGQLSHNVEVEGVVVPTLVSTEQKQYLLLYDGVLSSAELPSYEWEKEVKEYFARRNVHTVPVLSAQWWKSPRQEARKLAAQLLQ
ncbi:MAG: hypothetical protein NZM43_01965 [Saprospiraceae bacterium]|nr:hypothetical protein [Saprospiraceae bacterium]MDW8483066.1 hypothetical protein [Saprospiraceae bacterium]